MTDSIRSSVALVDEIARLNLALIAHGVSDD